MSKGFKKKSNYRFKTQPLLLFSNGDASVRDSSTLFM